MTETYETGRELLNQAGNAEEAAVVSKVISRMQGVEDLKKHMEALEFHLATLRVIYGDKLDEMKFTDGTHIVTPIYAALVNGHAALLNNQT